MATREEVMGAAERLIRRGDLGDAAGLLDMWLRANPNDAAAASKLASVRALADPDSKSRSNAIAAAMPLPKPKPPTPAPIAVAPMAKPTPPHEAKKPAWPDDPVARLELLLQRVQANRR
ncbi:MAG: hypothetical protein JST54_01435 [Deltaproteobacteria bacterium]|nr:hypothetical protein [Deltaproteobacteria bacterium]